MKIRTNVKAGYSANHNKTVRVRTGAKAGGVYQNHNLSRR